MPYLPDVGHDLDKIESPDALVGYHALAEAVALSAPAGSAVQIRLLSSGLRDENLGQISPYVLGRAHTEEGAHILASLVRATLPSEIVLEPIASSEQLEKLLEHVDVSNGKLASVAEVRRRIEELDPSQGLAIQDGLVRPGLMRWNPTPTGLRVACTTIAKQVERFAIVLHMEPTTPSVGLLVSLDELVSEVVATGLTPANPLRETVANDYLRRLRSLPRAALHVRVLIASSETIEPGVIESVGISLTSEGAFSAARPASDRDLLLASEMLRKLVARWWGGTNDDVLDELQGITDTAEAARVVRLPVPIRGGSPGLPSAPLVTLPRSAIQPAGNESQRIPLGMSAGGGEFSLGLSEINRHLLVCGLPGFGKTVTVQRLLAKLWFSQGVPFLVLDPAKTDYSELADLLGADATYLRLTPAQWAFNPFAVPEGVSPQAHAGRILAAFDSTFSLSQNWPLGYISLARGLFASYEEMTSGGGKPVPTLRSLYARLGDTLRRTRLAGPDGENVRAALLSRIEFLSRGPLGAALLGGESAGIDWGSLLSKPVIVEMREFGGPSERNLVFALLLAGLISFREAQGNSGGNLAHVTVLEEAHRVLRSGQEGNEGIRLFVEAIAELRGSGQGFVIVDQAPTQLDPGVLKLCGSILAHRLVDAHERSVVGASVLLDARQTDDLARLRTGEAVVYTSERVSSALIRVDGSRGDSRGEGRPRAGHSLSTGHIQMPYCVGCRATCEYEWPGRVLAAHFPPTSSDVRPLLEQYLGKTPNVDLARCATATGVGKRWASDLPSFQVWLQKLDDEVEARRRSP